MGDFTTLSLDLGSNLGFAVGRNGVIERSGEVALATKDTHPGHRWLRFQDWLYEHKDVNEILYEDVMFYGSAHTARVYCGLLAILQTFCLVHRIRLRTIGPKAIKKQFTGNGNSDKMDMCEVAHNLGWKGGKVGTDRNHDEADAIALMWVIYLNNDIQPRFA